jgi:hypothetical protein
MLLVSSPAAARALSLASCTSSQQSGFLVAAGLAGVAVGFVASGLGVAMIIGYWYDVLLKWEEWRVKVVVRRCWWGGYELALGRLKVGMGSVEVMCEIRCAGW